MEWVKFASSRISEQHIKHDHDTKDLEDLRLCASQFCFAAKSMQHPFRSKIKIVTRESLPTIEK